MPFLHIFRLKFIFHLLSLQRVPHVLLGLFTLLKCGGQQKLTLILLTWTIWRAPTNASKWRMGFNLAFKG